MHNFEERVDHPPVRGTRSLSSIYQRWNVVVFEPAGYAEDDRLFDVSYSNKTTCIVWSNCSIPILDSPSELHIQAAKRVLRYITGKMDYDMKSTSG